MVEITIDNKGHIIFLTHGKENFKEALEIINQINEQNLIEYDSKRIK